MILGFALAFCLSLFLFSFRYIISAFFTDIQSIEAVVIETFQVVAVAEFFDCCQGWLTGLIRGVGQFNHAMYGQLISFYLIGIPLGIFFGFYLDLGINGLWIGLGIALVIVSIYYVYLLVFHFDWYKIGVEAIERAKMEEERCKTAKINDYELIENL